MIDKTIFIDKVINLLTSKVRIIEKKINVDFWLCTNGVFLEDLTVGLDEFSALRNRITLEEFHCW